MHKRSATLIGATTRTFSYTGAAQTWNVPVGLTRATFDLYGGSGGVQIFPDAGFPGSGGRATATIPLANTASVQVNVGGQGQDSAGGFNGGGDATGSGAGGGGASDIRIGGTGLSDRVLVAGGGGGPGGCFRNDADHGSSGGDGGGNVGSVGTRVCIVVPGAGGGGGTQTAPGGATFPAIAGAFGVGGPGAFAGNGGEGFGGGGGGGWYGGGGGLGPGGGGGGSGRGPTGATFETGVRQGDGLVTVTYQRLTFVEVTHAVEALDLPSGFKNSLLKRLAGARKSVENGDAAGARDELASFISQVETQRGEKVTAADADRLIAAAEDLQGSVGRGG